MIDCHCIQVVSRSICFFDFSQVAINVLKYDLTVIEIVQLLLTYLLSNNTGSVHKCVLLREAVSTLILRSLECFVRRERLLPDFHVTHTLTLV